MVAENHSVQFNRSMSSSIRSRSPLCDSPAEEFASMATHGAGLGFSIFALVAMLMVTEGEPWRVVSGAIFGVTLVLLYGSSTLYHAISGHRMKAALQVVDHACIYLLIAGSYTPITLVSLRGPWGWTLFWIVWGLAFGGVAVKALASGRKDHWISTALYIAMGWLVVVAIHPLIRSLPPAALAWLVAGGLFYTLGIVFFAWQRLRFNHAIWHLFVLAGSACHVAAAAFHILRPP
jgi:hemolysin III